MLGFECANSIAHSYFIQNVRKIFRRTSIPPKSKDLGILEVDVMKYDLELEKAVKEIKKTKAKRVCIQLPDGLKQYAGRIKDKLEKETKAEILIWLGSCYGACDIPKGIDKIVDLVVQWGHDKWKF